ncbi:DUF4037 domain-containing protein [[Clostridium] fimetarium]|uniref:DUF4037 domain-containing protein n=1 Tax=[Clostridium] fimetarium TaxID=99656 RepID=A0A1I0MIR9_9FIRM|nr:DUF4037 domain-containing protein [[Clostridium] fimetarium]SEV87441.1 protein of unknown function [[Clostridium] fimetarium]
MNVIEAKDRLVNELSQCDKIKGIGQTGDINAELIPGNSDIDIFVLCATIPTEDERERMYIKYSKQYSEYLINVCHGGIWGYGDVLIIDGIDVMFMYFTIEEMNQYVDAVLNGKHLGKEGGFYPTGRLSSIESINILYENNTEWTTMIEKIKKHPFELLEKLFDYHISKVINDEDLGRAMLRKEVMFYHSVLENSLDHLMQALFAVNFTYFPSRKRSEKYIMEFKNVPDDCYDRILQIIEHSVLSKTLEKSVEELRKITLETVQIGKIIYKK